jgi:nitrate reductase gamma subunit
VQLALGLGSIPFSAQHLDGGLMMAFGEWAQRILTFRPGAAGYLAEAGWIFKLHIVLGMTLFLVFPFTRLVHVWSGFGVLAYVLRPYQMVRSRRVDLGAKRPAPQTATPARERSVAPLPVQAKEAR